MRLITHPTESRQGESGKPAANLTDYLSVFTPGVSPPGRKALVYPGFSPLAVFRTDDARGGHQEPDTAPFSNSSILRPSGHPSLVTLQAVHRRPVYWIDVFRMDSVVKRQKTGLGLEHVSEEYGPSGQYGYFGPMAEEWMKEKGLKRRPRRQRISHFSEKSALRLKHQVRNASQTIQSQFLLTYPADYPADGRIVKNHLDRWFRAIRKAYGSHSFGFEWVLEFQPKRKAPHFHVFFTWPPSNELRRFLAKKWNGILKAGKKHLWVHLRPRNFIKWDMRKGNYVMKYAQKKEQKETPEEFQNVGRFWGCSRNMIPQSFQLDFERLAEVSDWPLESIKSYFLRSMRKYHDSQLKVFAKRSFLHSEDWSRVKIPNTGQFIRQLVRYFYENSPPPGDTQYREPMGETVVA